MPITLPFCPHTKEMLVILTICIRSSHFAFFKEIKYLNIFNGAFYLQK